jgi:Holliday junction resolvase RusA-like endonuclease
MLTDDMTRDGRCACVNASCNLSANRSIGDATSNGFSLWSRCRKVVINIQNKCKDIKLDSGTCTVLKGNKNHYTISSPIPPDGRKNAIVRAKCRMGVPGSIECCIVYELLDPQRQREPLCQGYRVFIVIYLFVDSPSKYETKVFLFRTTSRSFAGGKNDIIKLRDNIIKNAEYSIDDLSVWNINEQVLSLKPDFVYGDPARLKVTLEKIESDTGRDLILYEMDT